jgi:hypothetical protein
MIPLLISTIWLATLVLVVAMCRIAARGDRARGQHGGVSQFAHRSPRLFGTPARLTRPLVFKVEDRRERAGSLKTARAQRARSSAARTSH